MSRSTVLGKEIYIYIFRSTVLGSNVYMYADQVPFKANQHRLSAQHTTHHTTLESENRVVTTRPTVLESTAQVHQAGCRSINTPEKHTTKRQQAFIWLLLAGGSLRWSNRAFMLTEEHVSLTAVILRSQRTVAKPQYTHQHTKIQTTCQ